MLLAECDLFVREIEFGFVAANNLHGWLAPFPPSVFLALPCSPTWEELLPVPLSCWGSMEGAAGPAPVAVPALPA